MNLNERNVQMKVYSVSFGCKYEGVDDFKLYSSMDKATEAANKKAYSCYQEYSEMWANWGEDAPKKYEDFVIWNDNERTVTMEFEQKIICIKEELLDGEWIE